MGEGIMGGAAGHILSYVIAIALIIVVANMALMSAVSGELQSAASTMANFAAIVGLVAGVSYVYIVGRQRR
jgi:membrane associated rhomboid family serine protease